MIASHPEPRTACHCRNVVFVLYPLRGVDLVISAARSFRSKGQNIPSLAILMPRGGIWRSSFDGLADLRVYRDEPVTTLQDLDASSAKQGITNSVYFFWRLPA